MKLRTKIKRIIGVALAALMAASTMAVMPVGAAGTGSIAVTAPEGTTPGNMTLSAYQVLVPVEGVEGQYTVTDGFTDFFSSAETTYEQPENQWAGTVYLTYEDNQLSIMKTKPAGSENKDYIVLNMGNDIKLDSTYFASSLLNYISSDNGSTMGRNSAARCMADWMSQYIDSKTSSMAATATTSTWTGTPAVATISNLSAGYYAVVSTNVPASIANYQSILQVVEDQEVKVNLKASEVELTKQVGTTEGTYSDTTTASIGDTLYYQITVDIPDFTNYDSSKTFTIGDTLTNQKLVDSSIRATVDTEPETTLTLNENDGVLKEAMTTTSYGNQGSSYTSGFELAFDVTKLVQYAGKTMTITYQAELMEEATVGNTNEVTLTYHNDPYTQEPTDITDTTTVYTYGLDIDKKFSDGSTDFSNVTFELYSKGGDESETKLINFAGTAGNYTLKDSETSTSVVVNGALKTDANGNLTIYGLKEGTYVLKETATKDGFQTIGDITITLTKDSVDGMKLNESASNVTGGVTVSTVTNATANDGDSTLNFTVLNQMKSNLPATGGMGTWMFTLGGLVLIAGAVVLLVVVRRKKEK